MRVGALSFITISFFSLFIGYSKPVISETSESSPPEICFAYELSGLVNLPPSLPKEQGLAHCFCETDAGGEVTCPPDLLEGLRAHFTKFPHIASEDQIPYTQIVLNPFYNRSLACNAPGDPDTLIENLLGKIKKCHSPPYASTEEPPVPPPEGPPDPAAAQKIDPSVAMVAGLSGFADKMGEALKEPLQTKTKIDGISCTLGPPQSLSGVQCLSRYLIPLVGLFFLLKPRPAKR